MRSKGRYLFFILMAVVWMGAACMLLGILLTRQHIPQKTMAQVTKAPIEKKTAYLTFDDGPSVLTENYLEILEKNHAVATFFVVGEQLDGDLVQVTKKAIQNGNEIGMHTYSHDADKIYQSEESYYRDLKQTKEEIKKKLGYTPKYFRFPWGSANAYVQGFKKNLIARMEGEGIGYVDWNVSGEDCVGCPSVESILCQFRKDYKKYEDPVILLHDAASCKATMLALPVIITELKQNGYSFDVISNRKKNCHFGEY